MNLKYIKYEVKNSIAKITLNRPEVGNALDPNLAEDFFAAVTAIEADPSIRVVIVTGAGKAFCSGGDVKYLLDVVTKLTPIEIRDFLMNLGRPIMGLRSLKQPVLASINGGAVGAGFDLILHCDLRIASDEAKMGPTWVRMGIIPVMGSMYLLPQFVGRTKATEMILRGQIVSGLEAESIGLINKAVPADKLDDDCMRLAEEIAANPPLATSIIKNGIHRALDWNLEHELGHALYLQASCMKTRDFERALVAFLEKTEPEFFGDK